MTSVGLLWNQPGDCSQSRQRNIRMSMNEYISLILIGLHVNPPADFSERGCVSSVVLEKMAENVTFYEGEEIAEPLP